ncbi:MAG: Coenzyme F420 hydrogenase/dehydrogenase, beta subunit C-terminal domain, partial [Thermoplasmatota archaeon]
MVKQGILKVHNGDVTSAINDFLKELLKSGKLSALLVPQTVPSKKVVFPALISNHDTLDANVFAPLLPVSEAKMISKITKFQPSEKPIGVVIHPCQMSALIELVKLNQANLDNIILIGVDCLGTFPVTVYADLAEKKNPLDIIFDTLKSNADTSEQYLRSACVVCNQPVPINADIVIGVFGMDLHKEILIEAVSDSGNKIIEDLKLDSFKDVKKREKHINEYIERKTKKLEAFIKEKTEKSDIERLTTLFDKCVNCHNCMNVCPICY